MFHQTLLSHLFLPQEQEFFATNATVTISYELRKDQTMKVRNCPLNKES